MKVAIRFFYTTLVFITALTMNTMTNAENAPALLVQDMPNVMGLPRHFRTTSDPLPQIKNHINRIGFSDLYIAGGGQVSESALQTILEYLGTKQVTIIDLRQESHGFLNGDAVSWYGPQNAENAGKTAEQIDNDQNKHLQALNQLTDVIVHKILKKTDDAVIVETEPLDFHVQTVLTEAELAKKLNVKYERLYVQDFHAPNVQEVDRFIQIVKALPADQWIYFHCRAGVGRTSTFMTMFDMMRNAKSVSFEDILKRQTAIGGKDLTELPSPNKYKYKYAVERLEFLQKFYEYARGNQDNFKTLWSVWNEPV